VSSNARRFAREWLPPAVLRRLSAQRSAGLRFVDGYGSWATASAAAEGYGAGSILRQVAEATELTRSGVVAFERDGVTFLSPETRWPVATALLMAAARRGGRLRVLDFGGSLGSLYWQHRGVLTDIDVTWGVVEQPEFVREGIHFADDRLSFHPTIEDVVSAGAPDLILLSSVLQYMEDPHAVLGSLTSVPAPFLLIDRTPMSALDHDVATVQHVPPQIYRGSYPAWILSETALRTSLGTHWSLREDFPGIEPDMTTSSGIEFRWRGYLFERG